MKIASKLTLYTSLFLLIVSCKNNTSTVEEYQLPEEIAKLPIGVEIGHRAPEIELPSLSGELRKLSELRGTIVLVDFWASWCTPCRKENPVLVEAYQEYNSKSFTLGEGFEIFSVSLDKDKNRWKEAVETDRLSWTYMLGDMKAAKSKPALDYDIQLIPVNFLLDKNGVIIAKNLRGEALKTKLESLLIQ